MRRWLRHLPLLVFIAMAYVLLPVMNGDYLYTIQDNSVFIGGRAFMAETIAYEGGWLAWAACYLTQFLYHPWLGSTLLIALWTLMYPLTLSLFSIGSTPSSLSSKLSPLVLLLPLGLLFNLLDYGYWLYYAKTPGFAFLPTLQFLLVLAGALLAKELLRALAAKAASHPLTPILLCLLLAGAVHLVSPWHLDNHRSSIATTLTDVNFKREMRLYRALDEFRFADALHEATAGTTAPTRLVMLYRTIALMQTGRLPQLFTHSHQPLPPYSDAALQVHISQLGAPLIYFHFGQPNYAYRRAMENTVKYGCSFRNLKMARCAIFSQEPDVAAKYLTLLKSSLFHRRWAIEHERWILNSTAYVQSDEYRAIAPLLEEGTDLLGDDDGLCEKFLLEHFASLPQAHSPQQEETALCASLLVKDTYAFCVHLYDYAHRHPQGHIPTLYQEGAILLATGEDSPITLGDFRFDALVSDRYNRFVRDYAQLSQMGLDEREMGARLRPLHGDTYWWYYYFCNDVLFY